MKQLLAKLFGVGKSEFSGFRLLAITAVLCIIGLSLANYLSLSPYSNYEQDTHKLDSLLLLMEVKKRGEVIKSGNISIEKFDPNTVSNEKLISYGFPPRLAKRLINYRATGARFNKPKDLLKLYGFPNSLFAQVVDYIVITPLPILEQTIVQAKKSFIKPKIKAEKKLPIFDLNLADTAIFQTIKGVGSKLSNRIVEYRTSLGGFVSKNQLYQIYRLDSSVVQKIIKSSIITTDFEPIKININQANKEQLAAHPYISWTEAKLIIAYRNQHGSFASIADLLKVYSINEDWVKINELYLSF